MAGTPDNVPSDGVRPDTAQPAAGLTDHGPYRYSRWDGSQRLGGLSADDVLDELSDDLLAYGDLSTALARLLARGIRPSSDGEDGIVGLRELQARLARARQELLERHQLGDMLADVRRELDEVLATERRGLERRLGAVAPADERRADSGEADPRRLAAALAARRQAELDDLPEDVGGRVRALQEYDFLEPEARARFNELVDRLRRQTLDSYFGGLADAIRSTTPDQLARNREMVRDLNGLLAERLAGGDPDVSDFLAQHGTFFPGARSLDDIIEQLAERMTAMQSLLSSLAPERRAELQQMMDSLLRDDRLRWDLAQLAATLDQLLPGGLGRRFEFSGEESLSLDGALEQLGRLQRIDGLTEQLAEAGSPASLDVIDPTELADLLDQSAADDLRQLQDAARRLEEAGLAQRRGNSLELTPRGARRIGQRVLDELFARLEHDVLGGHARRAVGAAGERGEGSRRYEFGQPFDLDLQRTLANAALRQGPADRLELAPADFEVHQTEAVTRVSTVLLVDMSRSMLLRGCFLAAKKVAIALDMLIRTRYPRDELHIVGFAYYAREIQPSALAGLAWHGYEYGTNLQHGLQLARSILARSHAANREVVVITDGEPTAHFEDGQVEFSYPPTRRTLRETLAEVGRCTRAGITINTFMLERSPALTAFVEQLTRLNRGRAFYATPERLGEYLLVDYVERRSRTR